MSGAAVVIGASGAIGGALESALLEEGAHEKVWGFGRSRSGSDRLDLLDEASIAAAAARASAGPAPTLVLIATGLLHEGERMPERGFKDVDAEWMARSYAVNAIGPALVLKHFLPLLPKSGEPVVATLSARVGSIGDNSLGGWHGYRASKAALNMLVRNAAIEAKRQSPRAIVIGLHPGTVDSALSKPFQGSVAAGSLFAPDRAALQLLDVIEELKPKDSGKLFAWDGTEIPF
ncbi:SDR family NAD(P)-dependent oxidoreductase [Sphingomonas sp. PL-96]|uniref:SDR family NAD(P)-dependent oxidoreductase n=1 Tax=Sphingomonas sp. PL-96 TaxID=2887201 RepID=UPI001E56018D|nr:SDR family NAD(P)-dependent oxidoreductase [Sphingomonas sp. PL-96]MCC2976720.1 SDR family NAD(P)-dependent oxidoreductase [Sphingomonas sp. PL-96]